jgi:hypothetical protein
MGYVPLAPACERARDPSGCSYQVTSSTAGHGGPSRRASRNATPDRLPLGCWSPGLQRCVAMIASTTPRHSSIRSWSASACCSLTAWGTQPRSVLDGPVGGVLEVDEERPVLRVEQVPRVRLAVQQLLGGAPADDRSPQIAQPVGEDAARSNFTGPPSPRIISRSSLETLLRQARWGAWRRGPPLLSGAPVTRHSSCDCHELLVAHGQPSG